jgi:two-component system chemotaxis response regulator CheY
MEGRILVAHRNELILDVIQEMLQNVGYASTLTSDGNQALAKAMSEHYHLIIVDRNLAGEMDGIRLVERLRKYGVKTPIIGTAPETTWSNAENNASGEQIDFFLPSPFGYHELVNAASALLNRDLVPPIPLEDIEPTPEVDPEHLFEPAVEETHEAPKAPEPNVQSTPEPTKIVPHPSVYKTWEPQPSRQYSGPPRILLIDTNDEHREEASKHLIDAGFEVTAIKDGQEAYEDTMLNDYELILTDLWLVGMDGFETIEAMRKSGVEAPIGVLTSYVTREMVQELLEFHICKVFIKPVKPNTLLSFVQGVAKVS